MSAKARVAGGGSLQESSGEMFAPSQVNLLGMSVPFLKSPLEIEKDIFFPAAPDCEAESPAEKAAAHTIANSQKLA